MTATRVVAVLAGGGVKAAAHIGAWQALDEAGLRPGHVVATSFGAVIGACFAAGLTVDEVLERLGRVERDDVAHLRPLAGVRAFTMPSLFPMEPFRRALERLVPVRRFADLQLPLQVSAVDRDYGNLVMFGPGGPDAPLIDALLASCALPLFYPPVVIGGRRYVDGGVRAVLPLDPAAAVPADLAVAVHTGPGFDEPVTKPPIETPALIQAHNDMTGILMAALTEEALARWRADAARAPLVYVRPRVDRHVTFRLDLAEHYVGEGYRATTEALVAAGYRDPPPSPAGEDEA